MAYVTENGKKRGRPSILNPAMARAIYRALAKGNSKRTAYSLVNISEPTFRRWCQTGEKHLAECEDSDNCLRLHGELAAYTTFYLNVKKAEQLSADNAVGNLRRIGKKEWLPNAWLLERRHKEDWTKPTEIQHKVSGHTTHEHRHELVNATPQQKLKMAAALAAQAKMQIIEVPVSRRLETPQDVPSNDETS